jgi:hypothetical protein
LLRIPPEATRTSLFQNAVPDTNCTCCTHPYVLWTVHKKSSAELGTRNAPPD